MESVTINVSKDLFARLQSYARPLVDTPDSVLTRIFDHYDATASAKARTFVVALDRQPPEHFTTSRGVKLPIGLKIFASYRNQSPNAVVTARGIEYNGKAYDDPSAAAKAAKLDAGASATAASTNGWEFWMMEAGVKGRITSIDSLRKKS
jgi:hypothetical protein